MRCSVVGDAALADCQDDALTSVALCQSDRAPAIVQDSLVAAGTIGAGVHVFDISSVSVLTGSAIVAALIGFALLETLANAFTGMALQLERPFRVGHWITVGD